MHVALTGIDVVHVALTGIDVAHVALTSIDVAHVALTGIDSVHSPVRRRFFPPSSCVLVSCSPLRAFACVQMALGLL